MNSYTKESLDVLALIGRMVARDGKRDQLFELLDEAVAVCSRHEPDGALTVIFHTSPANPDLVVLYEHYPGRASLEFHRANYERIPVYGEIRARMNELLATPVEIVEMAQPIVRYSRADRAANEIPRGDAGTYGTEAIEGVVFVARFLAREGKRDELLPLFDEAAAMQAEHEPDGALTVVLHNSPTNLDEVLVYEHYPSQAALDDHRAMLASYGPYQDLRRRLGELLTQPPEIVEVAVPVVRFVRVRSQEKEASA